MNKQQDEWFLNNPDKKDEYNENRTEKLWTDIHKYYEMYTYRAKKSEIEFNLIIEQFEDIVTEVCYYCGDKDKDYFNSVDRIDSCLGYTEENCVAACSFCNMAKGSRGISIFILQAKHMHHFKETAEQLYQQLFLDKKFVLNYKQYKKKSKSRVTESFIIH